MFHTFENQLVDDDDLLLALRNGLIGNDVDIPGPYGMKKMIYADYTASGRGLVQIEDYIRDSVLPYYANSHTETSYCGGYMNALRRAARAEIAEQCGAGDECAVIFAGSGATAGLNKLTHLLLAPPALHRRHDRWNDRVHDRVHDRWPWQRQNRQPLVLIGPYEHHSNILPWREIGAEVQEINEAPEGGVDLADLESRLQEAAGRQVIGAFSAASNVTGILSDVVAVTRLLKRHGALAVWDYAAGGPYLPVSMTPTPDAAIDAVVMSPHKFVGGPGASGLLIVRKSALRTTVPTAPGGGTVTYVSGWGQDYVEDVCLREEAGTPNIIGDIRAALSFIVKRRVGVRRIRERGTALLEEALSRWNSHANLEILGHPDAERLPIVSFLIRDGAGGYLHHRLVTRMLSDLYGIQAREGCSCAGPYGHRLLNVSRAESEAIRQRISAGYALEKPGWVRLNLCYLTDNNTANSIVSALEDLATRGVELARHYSWDEMSGSFVHHGMLSRAAS